MITICEVGPRDGLQNERDVLPPETRAELINRLAATGLRRIEVVSFVRDDAVPQMAAAEDVVGEIERPDGVEYAGLVLNEKGFERFQASGLDRVNVTLGATESFNQRNANATLDEATKRASRIATARPAKTTVTISVAFGCPFEGRVDPAVVTGLVDHFRRLGAQEIVLADTIGVATPRQVRTLIEQTKADGFHGHNTRNTGFANAYAALEAGATTLDASIGGLGGCPVRAARHREHRDRGPRVHARRRRNRDRRRPRCADRDLGVARGGPRAPARGSGLPRGQFLEGVEPDGPDRRSDVDVPLVAFADLLGDADRGHVLRRDQRDHAVPAE